MYPTKIRPCAAALLTALLCGTAGAAETADPAPMTAVSYADLNLGSKAGVARLYERIAHAADEVCDLPRDTRRLKPEADLEACKQRVTDRAVLEVGLPALSALHMAKTGRGVAPERLAKAR